jgi:diguanylate cyclase (GGDEF)-like protein
LRASVRQDDFVARFGGDEFVLLLPGASPASLDEVVKRIALLSGIRNEHEDRPYRLSFSIGSAIFEPETDDDARAYLSRLDTAMYKDKLSRKSTGQAGLPEVVDT